MIKKGILVAALMLLVPIVAHEQSAPPSKIADLKVKLPLPTGATFNKTTGKFSWTPAAGQVGVYYIEFEAADGKGGYDSELVTITVEAP